VIEEDEMLYCERAPLHIEQASWRVTLVMDKDITQTLHLCEKCHTYVKQKMIIVDEMSLEKPPAELILSVQDWDGILAKYGLVRRAPDEPRIVVAYEQNKSLLLGLCVDGQYGILWMKDKHLEMLDKTKDDAMMRQCCANVAKLACAELVV
jgi:hypothetical protein